MTEPVVEVVEFDPPRRPRILGRYWYLLIAAGFGLAVFFVWWRYYAFTDEGYAPDQPIAYSHQLHAGELRIPCEYCHFNARRGRHAGVPPASVCLGCHGDQNGGIVGRTPQGKKEVERLKTYLTSGAEGYQEEAAEHVRKEGGVVHWNRVHMLPDHVYFAHEWHIKAGVACQTCHGPVETMEVVRQQADLTMGWCVRCHRNDDYVRAAEFAVGEDGGKRLANHPVGVGNYDVIRHRRRPDQVVEFVTEHVGHGHGDHGEAHGPEERADGNGSRFRWTFDGSFDHTPPEEIPPGERREKLLAYTTSAQITRLERLFEKYPDLPRWRIPDLPESHRAFYTEELAGDLGTNLLQNAPTHCSTCHQ